MSKTGRYVYDKELGKVVKVDDKVRHCTFDDVMCPISGYYSEHLGTFVRSRRHKRDLLKKEGLREVGTDKVRNHTYDHPRNAVKERSRG